MKLPQALEFAKKIATNFIGRPLDFISELRKSPDTQRASHFFETGFSRYKTGTLKKESALGEVLSIVAPGAHGSLASDAQLREKHCNLLAECVRVEQSSGVGSNNRPKTEATIEGIATLSAYLGQLNAGKAPATPAASAPKPAPAPAPAASKPAVVPNAASIGNAIITAITSEDKTVRESSQRALGTIAAGVKLMARADFDTLSSKDKSSYMRDGGRLTDVSSQANVSASEIRSDKDIKPVLLSGSGPGEPDFSFISLGSGKRQMIEEFRENGGLTEGSWFAWRSARKDFTTVHGAAPETLNGRAIVIPAICVESKAGAATRLAKWASADASFEQRKSQARAEIENEKRQPNHPNKDYNLKRLEAHLKRISEDHVTYQGKRETEYKDWLSREEERLTMKRETLF